MYPNSPTNTNPQQNPFLVKKEDEIDLKVLVFNYLQYWPWIAGCVLMGLFGAYLVNKYATPVYNVEATVLVKDDKPTLGADLFATAGFGQQNSNTDNEIGILKSYSMAEETVREMSLNVSYFIEGLVKTTRIYGKTPILVSSDWSQPHLVGGLFKLEVIDSENFELKIEEEEFSVFDPKDPFNKRELVLSELPKSVYSFGKPVELDTYQFTVNQISSLPGDVIFFRFEDNPSLALGMKGQLSVAPLDKFSSILTLSVQTPIRKLGEDYINQLMKTYLQRELNDKNRATENTIRFITQQLTGITDSLQFSENKLQKYRSDNRIFNLSEEGSAIFERLQELESQKSEIELNLKYYRTLQSYINSNQLDELVSPSMIGVTDPLLNALVQNLSELQAEKVRLSANFSDQTPRVKDVNTRLESAANALMENISSAITNTQSTLSDLNGRIRTIESQISTLPETERNLIGIERQFTINENIYIYLLQKKAEAEITLASNLPKNSVLDYAKAGQIPVEPKKSQNLLIGLILGLLIPIGLITIKDYLNNKIEDPKELENQLKVPLIGMIGRNSTNDAIPVLNNPRSTVTESFRSLRADLSYLSPKQNNLAILFTSAISGEGKTFVSMNMAAVFALMGKKTILIGLDLRKPRIAEDFNLENDKGMSTCLSSDTPWQDVVKPSGYDHLEVILSGPIPPNPAELLLQERFGKIIAEIKKEYDVVIFDCPPVGLVSEAKELFAFSDINFFVFRQGYSEKSNTLILNNLVEKGGVSKIYGILNDVHIDKGYGYGYGYGYGNNSYGYHEEAPLPWWKRALKMKS